jgi:hypothetical protein
LASPIALLQRRNSDCLPLSPQIPGRCNVDNILKVELLCCPGCFPNQSRLVVNLSSLCDWSKLLSYHDQPHSWPSLCSKQSKPHTSVIRLRNHSNYPKLFNLSQLLLAEACILCFMPPATMDGA